MSFHESDFPGLLKTVNKFNEQFKNPSISDKLIKETYKYYEIIPIYPGLIENTISNMIEKTESNKLKTGDWIAFEHNNNKYAGRIKNITDNSIEFSELTEIKNYKNKEISKSDIKEIIRINENQLEKDWPMLIFEKVE